MGIYEYNHLFLFVVLMFYKTTINSDLANFESLLLGEMCMHFSYILQSLF